MARDILIIGAGVSGLSAGIRLQEQGIQTRILTRARSPHTTSDRAAAIWFPYQAQPADRVAVWCRSSLQAFDALCGEPASGVSITSFIRLYREPMPDPLWMSVLPGRHRRCRPEELPAGFVDGVLTRVPLIEVQRYMPWLMSRYRALGGSITDGELHTLSGLVDQHDIVVNCAGLGARALVGDSRLYPIRGQLLYVQGWTGRTAWSSDIDPEALAYIIPRSDVCVLGGSARANRWEKEADEQVASEILERCAEIVPAIEGIEVVRQVVGLRPGRDAIRLERVMHPSGLVVVHNYGHGGAGFTLSWGCADEVARLVAEVQCGTRWL